MRDAVNSPDFEIGLFRVKSLRRFLLRDEEVQKKVLMQAGFPIDSYIELGMKPPISERYEKVELV